MSGKQLGPEGYEKMEIGEAFLIERRLLADPYGYEDTDCITVMRQIQSISYSNVKTGTVVVNYQKNMVDEYLSKSVDEAGSALVLLDSEHMILAKSSNIEGMSKDEFSDDGFYNTGVSEWECNNTDYLRFVTFSSKYNMYLVNIIPKNIFYKNANEIHFLTVVLILLSLLLGIGISYLIARNNIRNLSNVLSIIQAAERGDPFPNIKKRPRNQYEYMLHNMISVLCKTEYAQSTIGGR